MYPRLYYFEPPDTSEPDWHETALGELLPRIQALLANRTKDEVEYLIATLNYLFGPAAFELLRDYPKVKRIRLMSPAALLHAKLPKISIERQDPIPNARWPEYFGALALAHVGRMFEVVNPPPEADPSNPAEIYSPPRLFVDPESLSVVVEALTIAESLAPLEEAIDQRHVKRIKLGKREAAIQGNQRRYVLHDKLRGFWIQNRTKFRNNRKAAILYWFEELSRTDQLTLVPKFEDFKDPEDSYDRIVRTLRPKLKN